MGSPTQSLASQQDTLDYGSPESKIWTPLPELSKLPGAANEGQSPTTSELDRSRTRDYGPAPDPQEHHEHSER
eukprot:843495-Pyramimonas_sp.AAC.1